MFTIPGIFLLKKSKANLNFWENLSLGTVVGLTSFSLLSYLLLVLHIHILLIPILLVINLFALKIIKGLKNEITFASKKNFLLLFIIFSIGIIGQLLVIAPSGLNLSGDLVFWSSHGHDGLWHISLMQEYQKGYPFQNPIYAGERLVNYHFFSDIAPSDFNYFFKIPLLDLYFRFFPLLFSVLIGSLSYLLGKKLGGSVSAGIWASIFTYFAGSFGYIVTFLKDQSIAGESIFWASQIQSSIGNPPQIAAFIVVLAFLYLFGIYVKNTNKIILFICTLLAGSLVVFKIYGAVVVIVSLGLVGIWHIIKERKFNIFLLFLSSSIVSALLYFPNSSGSTSFLIYEPWWYIRTMVVTPDRLNWIDMELRRQTYNADHNWKRVIQLEGTAFLIFFFGNLGMRFFGLISLPKFIRDSYNNKLNLLITFIMFVSFILPMLFLQKGVASNSIQFFQYFLLLFGILSAITINELSKKIKLRSLNIFIHGIIIALMIPTQISLINSFYSRSPFAKIESSELSALKFLKENTNQNSVILTAPYNQYLNLKSSVPQIWDWSDTGYVTALSNRRTYLADTEQVDIMGYDLKQRLKIQEEIFNQDNPELFTEHLKKISVDYLYFPIEIRPKVDLGKTNLQSIFSNDLVEIWQVK